MLAQDTDLPSVTVLFSVIVCLAVLIFAVLAVGLVLVIRDTVRGRGNWGINLKPPGACPECGEPVPVVRAPRSARQALWGGWTCTECGTEIDKWGKVIEPAEVAEVLPADEETPSPRRPPDERFKGKNDV
ncbi:MAG TPA: hypothetical protein VJ739_01005 [Gemmataceae bacterium]|nr:hypothetical protein [Gemmataceae bacterium]